MFAISDFDFPNHWAAMLSRHVASRSVAACFRFRVIRAEAAAAGDAFGGTGSRGHPVVTRLFDTPHIVHGGGHLSRWVQAFGSLGQRLVTFQLVIILEFAIENPTINRRGEFGGRSYGPEETKDDHKACRDR